MKLGKQTGLALLGLIVLLPAAPARADDLVVVEARGIGLHPGQTINSQQPLVLKEGQHVSLITSSGSTLSLDGPYNKAPAADQNSGTKVSTVLAALVTQNQVRTGEVGATRGAAPVAKLPNPWLLDVSRTGNVCLLDGHKAVFWRPETKQAIGLTIMPADRSWKSQALWPAGADRLAATTDAPVHGGATYLVSLNTSQVAVTVNNVPTVLNNNQMRAAWMAEKGCEAQAEALLRTRT